MAKKYCENCNITHSSIMCYFKPRKRINQQGKQYQTWQDTRKLWIGRNPPDQNGYWYCKLKLSPQCIQKMDIKQLTLDHIIPRSHNPKLRHNLNNLQPACIFCNTEKGSKLIF